MGDEVRGPVIGSAEWAGPTPGETDAILARRIAAYEEGISARGGKRPRREGYVLERIADIHTLRRADSNAQSGKVRLNRHIRRHNSRAEQDLRALQLMILTLSLPEARYTADEITSGGGKTRAIARRDYFPWRILEHAIMEVVMPIMLRHLINDSVACIKGKGLHYGVRRMRRMMRLNRDCAWFWKCDYKKFYQSVPHDVIEAALRRRIKDENFFKLVRLALFSYESGADTEDTLRDEETKKRRANWVVHQPAAGCIRGQRGGPPHEGDGGREVLHTVLR